MTQFIPFSELSPRPTLKPSFFQNDRRRRRLLICPGGKHLEAGEEEDDGTELGARRQTRKCYFYNDGSKFPPRNEPNRNDTMAVPAELEGSLHNASIAIFGTGDLQRSRPCDNAKQGSLEFTDVRTQTSFPALQISYGNAGVMEYLLGVVAVGVEIRIC